MEKNTENILYEKGTVRIEKTSNGYALINEIKNTLDENGNVVYGKKEVLNLTFETKRGTFGWNKELIDIVVKDREKNGLHDDYEHEAEEVIFFQELNVLDIESEV